MVIKNKLAHFFHKQFSLTILDIALASIFVALWVVSSKLIRINFGFMRVGIVYAWVITIGLIFKPFLALIITIIADNLVQMFSGFGFWMIEYAIIYPMMVLLVCGFKKILACQNDYLWSIFVVIIMSFAIIFCFVISIMYRNFENKSQNEENAWLFSSWFIHALLWSLMIIITTIFALVMIRYLKSKKPRLKTNISIGVIVTLMVIIFVWLWGPIAQIQFLVRHHQQSAANLYTNFHLFLIPRVLKTPILLPIYIIIVTNVHYAYETLNFKKQNQW